MKAELELGQAKQRGSLEERIALICAENTKTPTWEILCS